MGTKKAAAAFYAVFAAALYAVNIPLSKILLEKVSPTMMAAFLYLGAGTGMALFTAARRIGGRTENTERLTRKELPYTLGMIVLDIAAPIFLMLGLKYTAPANVSLLNNFEIVATSVIALVIFKEKISPKLWAAIGLITLASIILSFEDYSSLSFSYGSGFVLLACVCWGFENNCTKMLSSKSPQEIVIIKGIFSGCGSAVIALAAGERFPAAEYIIAVMALGFVAYGLSIKFYIQAQKKLGAAKTSAYYAVSPFIGVVFSFILFGSGMGAAFFAALAIMIAGTAFIIRDNIALQHIHSHCHVHSHMHEHNGVWHEHEHIHEHSHYHVHSDADGAEHTHQHDQLSGHGHSHSGI